MIAVSPLAHPAKNPVPSGIGTLNVNGVFASITNGVSLIVVGAVVAAAKVEVDAAIDEGVEAADVDASRTTVVSLTFDELFVHALTAPANSNRLAKPAYLRRATDESVVISSDYVVLFSHQTRRGHPSPVVKIEPPRFGDTMRHLGSRRNGMSELWATCNRSKRSVALDLATLEAQATALSLIAVADVFIQNYRPDHIPGPVIGHGYNLGDSADGFFSLTAITDTHFRNLMTAIGKPELADDPRLATMPQRMSAPELYQGALIEWRQHHTAQEVEDTLRAHDVPVGRVTPIDEVHQHPQVVANATLMEHDHPHLGRMREPRPAMQFGGAPAAMTRPAPLLGEHNDEVITSWLAVS
jgi:CoA-transferase family III